jgi:hypothetical protein
MKKYSIDTFPTDDTISFILDSNVWRSKAEFIEAISRRTQGKIICTDRIANELISPKEGQALALHNSKNLRKYVQYWAKPPEEYLKEILASLTLDKEIPCSLLSKDSTLNILDIVDQIVREDDLNMIRADRKRAEINDRKIESEIRNEIYELLDRQLGKSFCAENGSTKQIVSKCVEFASKGNDNEGWWGFPLPMILISKYGIIIDPNIKPSNYGDELACIIKSYHKAPGLKLFHAHIARLLLQHYEDGSRGSKLDNSWFADAEHLLYCTDSIHLITKESKIFETAEMLNMGKYVIVIED